jgi:hypothetical protein
MCGGFVLFIYTNIYLSSTGIGEKNRFLSKEYLYQ